MIFLGIKQSERGGGEVGGKRKLSRQASTLFRGNMGDRFFGEIWAIAS
jgi:hypothetical protein